MLRLPSGRLLQYYKNSCRQSHGLNPDSIEWMRIEADRLNLSGNAMVGGIVLDEMSIQVHSSYLKSAFSLFFHFLLALQLLKKHTRSTISTLLQDKN